MIIFVVAMCLRTFAIVVLLYTFLFTLIRSQAIFDTNDLDWSVRPTDDFFQFVNGQWINRTQIPPALTLWGSMFSIKYDVSVQLKNILDELVKNDTLSPHPKNSIDQKLTDLYLAATDTATIEKVGLKPIEKTLEQLDRVKTYQELIDFVLNWYKKSDEGFIFKFDVYADRRNSSINAATWKQTGLMLSERNFYFQNDLKSKMIRSKFIEYIDRLLQLTNFMTNSTTTMNDAEDVFALELQLAASHQTPAELRDAENNYYKYSIDQLVQMMPNLDWRRILKTLGIKRSVHIVNQPDYYRSLDRLIVNQPLKIWKNKIRVHLISEFASFLNDAVFQARFDLFDHLIYGRQEPQPRWMKVIEDINNYIGEMLGRIYVSRYFSEGAKQKILSIVYHLMDTYRQRIVDNEWMSSTTKEKALMKLKKMKAKIGYPSTWKTYDSVKINRWKYFDSMCSIFQYTFQEKIKDLDRPPNRDEWFIPPQTSNAFYNPSFNEIVYPAGILQAPYFSDDADDAINYGAAGFSIAHELTHGFDDQGRKYDENGELHSWWTAKDADEFFSRTQLLVEQYNHYTMLNNSINGLLTLGENIADLGGVEIAFDAFSQTPEAHENSMIDGFTAKQRFFLSYARTWRVKFTEERMLYSIKVERHSPPSLRTNGPLSNVNAFYEAFNVRPGDRMYREASKRVHIW